MHRKHQLQRVKTPHGVPCRRSLPEQTENTNQNTAVLTVPAPHATAPCTPSNASQVRLADLEGIDGRLALLDLAVQARHAELAHVAQLDVADASRGGLDGAGWGCVSAW